MKSFFILLFIFLGVQAQEQTLTPPKGAKVIKPTVDLSTRNGLILLGSDDKIDNWYMEKTLISSAPSNLDEATELMGGEDLLINGQVPYETVPIPALCCLSDEEKLERQLFNLQSRNRFMRRLARSSGQPLFSDNSNAEVQREIASLNTLRDQFGDFHQRQSLDMENLQRNTLPRFRSLRDGLQSKANTIAQEIKTLQGKIARGELDPENCGFINFSGGGCADNNSRLANKVSKFNDYMAQINSLDQGIGQLETGIQREIGNVQGKLDLTDEEFKNKIVDIIKNSGSFALKEEAQVLRTMIDNLREALKIMLGQLKTLNSEIALLKGQSGISRQQVDMEELKAELTSELNAKINAAKEEAVARACNEAPSCAGPSFEATGGDDSPRDVTPAPLSLEALDGLNNLLDSMDK